MQVIGQEKVRASIENMVKLDKVGHGYLLYGATGIGKFTVANFFANMYLDEKARTSDLIFLDFEDQSIHVDDIRDMLSQVNVRPMYAKKKVFIIRNSDNMTDGAQNALLKTLEEPPGYALIILTASNPLKLHDTIRSRLFSIELDGYSFEDCMRIIKANGVNKSDESIGYAIKLAQGVPGKALSWLESDENEVLREGLLGVFNSPFNLNLFGIKLFNLLSSVKEKEKEQDKNKKRRTLMLGMEILEIFFRDVLRYKLTRNIEGLINEDKSFIIIDVEAKLKTDGLVRIIQYIEQAYSSIIGNVNADICINQLCLKIQEEFN